MAYALFFTGGLVFLRSTAICRLDMTPPEEVTDLAYVLVLSAARRGMGYEGFTFEVEGGDDDVAEYTVTVKRNERSA